MQRDFNRGISQPGPGPAGPLSHGGSGAFFVDEPGGEGGLGGPHPGFEDFPGLEHGPEPGSGPHERFADGPEAARADCGSAYGLHARLGPGLGGLAKTVSYPGGLEAGPRPGPLHRQGSVGSHSHYPAPGLAPPSPRRQRSGPLNSIARDGGPGPFSPHGPGLAFPGRGRFGPPGARGPPAAGLVRSAARAPMLLLLTSHCSWCRQASPGNAGRQARRGVATRVPSNHSPPAMQCTAMHCTALQCTAPQRAGRSF